MLLAACIEAIFVVLGRLNITLRQCPLALNKWEGIVVSHRPIALGLIFGSRRLFLSMTAEYLHKVRMVIDETFPMGFTSFRLDNVIRLTGKLAWLRESTPWVSHLMSHIYALIPYFLC